MSKVLIVCHSITGAQKIMNLLSKNGLWTIISRTPSDIRLKACSYSVVFYEKDEEKVKSLLKNRNYAYLNMYLCSDGLYREIEGDAL